MLSSQLQECLHQPLGSANHGIHDYYSIWYRIIVVLQMVTFSMKECTFDYNFRRALIRWHRGGRRAILCSQWNHYPPHGTAEPYPSMLFFITFGRICMMFTMLQSYQTCVLTGCSGLLQIWEHPHTRSLSRVSPKDCRSAYSCQA